MGLARFISVRLELGLNGDQFSKRLADLTDDLNRIDWAPDAEES